MPEKAIAPWRARTAGAAGVALCVASCAVAPDRPATPTVDCAEAALERDLHAELRDKQAHCAAGGLIARYCSPAEARLAGLAKELRDVFSAGDPSWADWQATRAGVRCAASSSDVATILACCENAVPGEKPGRAAP